MEKHLILICVIAMAIGMADYKRSIRCSGCGNEITVYMNGNFDLTQLSAVGKCPGCKSTIQLDFAMVEKEASGDISPVSEEAPPPMDMFSTPSADSDSVAEEVSQTTAEEETSDMLKDLMG